MFNKYILLTIALLTLLVTGCGSGTSMAPAPAGPTPLGQPLPSVFDEFHGDVTRGASDVTTIPGSDAQMSSGGTVVDTTMLLQSSETEMAWALYKISGLAGRNASTLGIELSLPTLGSEYSVGVANFSDGVWDFLIGASGLPEFNYDLTQEQSRLVSQLGNLYFVVVVSGGNAATVLQASVISELQVGEDERFPLRAQRPSVSEGLPDSIQISWSAVSGATSYELWRRLDTAGDSAWELLATQPDLAYTDIAIELSVEYAYKVRGVNSLGAGGFSDKRSGFAGTPPPGFDADEDEDIEVEGPIQALSEGSITVGGLTFAINQNTRFLNDDEQAIEFTSFAVGQFVEVEADSDLTGGWIALTIELEDEDGGGGDEQRFEATLEAIDATTLKIQGVSIAHNATTEFRDANEAPATWEDFSPGDFVKVRAEADQNGNLVATRVELDDEDGDGDGDGDGEPQFFTGLIDSISTTEIVVAGTSIALTAQTTYSDNAGNPVELSFFSAGMLVQVDATGSVENGWTAVHVQEDIEDQGDQVFTGTIDSISATEIVIAGTSIALTAATTYSNNAGDPVEHSFFSAGMQAEVDANGSPEAGWTAVHVQEEIEN